MTDHLQGLLHHHLAALRARGLNDQTIAANGYTSETDAKKIAAELCWKRPGKTLAPAIRIPFHALDGSNSYARYRPDVPRRDRNDKPIKYESPKGLPNRAYLPAGDAQYLDNPRQELAVTEGEFKAAAISQELLPAIGLVGVMGWKVKDNQRLLPELERVVWNGRPVFLIFDSDVATNENVQAALAWLAKHLTDRGAKVRWVRLPDGPNGTKMGADDFLVAYGKGALRKLLDAAEDPPAVDPESARGNAENADPAKEADAILAQSKHSDGEQRLRSYRGEFFFWRGGCFQPLPDSDVEAQVYADLNRRLVMVKRSHVGNIVAQIAAKSVIYSTVTPPAWLGDKPAAWNPAENIVAKNGIINLPAYIARTAGSTDYITPATPRFFTFNALDYDFDTDAPEPTRWLEFLGQLWPEDEASISCLQEWAGYLIVHWTNLQKILCIIGPRRAGKGVISRVLQSVIGEANVAAPTMASLSGDYGLWALLDKSAAFISDARLSNRTDSAVVVERLLNISGEDRIDVPRKYLDTLRSVKLPTRIVLFSNEMPGLSDSSGALPGRLICLRLVQSFYGSENPLLTDELLEDRAGILRWAIGGWSRLRRRGYFVQPASGRELADQMEEIASPVAMFVREFCTVDPVLTISVADLFAGWRLWCSQKGIKKPGSEAIFGRNLAAACTAVRRVQQRHDGDRYRAYQGIDLLPEVWKQARETDLSKLF